MTFNSVEFVLFLIVVATVYYCLNRNKLVKWRNIWLLLCSFYFYGQFNWKYLILLIFVITVNYVCALLISRETGFRKKAAVSTAIVLSIGQLALMKYAYFFDESIWLPVGLSFFTFQALAYAIDVYRNKITAERNIASIALYVSFLPTILSGPIERARNILPQLKSSTPMDFNNFSTGIKLFIWGLFKKAVIADRIAQYVDEIYLFPDSHTGATLAIAAVFYSIQIYCDFSGYADMAVGTGRILGFKIMENFRFPYFALSIKDFWARWHISLTSWFREYVYFSLGGNRVNELRWIFNILAIFILSGIWHGATAAFIIWGGIHGLAYLTEHYLKINKQNVLYGFVCFIVVTLAWIFFRIEDSSLATSVVGKIFSDLVSRPVLAVNGSSFSFFITMALLAVFTIREIVTYRSSEDKKVVTNVECILLLLLISLFGVGQSKFVYFQF